VTPCFRSSRTPSSHLSSPLPSLEKYKNLSLSRARSNTDLQCREGTPAYTLIATQTPPQNPESRNPAPDFTAIVLNLIRLEKESTDIIITINVPHIKGEYSEEEVNLQLGKQGKLISDAVEYAAKIWETFKIKDWGVFNEV
jgi:hypothetical protein